MEHRKDCNWEKSNCEYKETHNYCPHEEHRCNCTQLNYQGDDMHLLDYEDGHMRIDCWCKPELVHDGDNHYLLHKDKNGKTILNDPKFSN